MKKKQMGLLLVLLTGMVTGCMGNKQEATVISEELTEMSKETTNVSETEAVMENTTSVTEEMTWEERHGGQVKEDENYLYLCSCFRIYKVDKASGATEVLWEQTGYKKQASMFDYGNALLIGDKLYFVEAKPTVDLEENNYVLSVIGTDGSDYQTLLTDIPIGYATLFLQDESLYIINYEGELCYQLLEDGSLKQLKEGTYEKMPQGYQCTSYENSGSYYLSAAESMERYGCIIAYDEYYNLVQVKEDGTAVKMQADWVASLTEDWLLLVEYDEEDILYRLWDGHTLEAKDYVTFPGETGWNIIGMDKEYIYYGYNEEIVDGIQNFVVEKRAIESGETERLFGLEDNSGTGMRYFGREYGMLEFSQEDKSFYYADADDYKMYVMKRSLEDVENEEVLTPAFFDSLISEVGTTESYLERIFSDSQPEVLLMTIQTERLVVDEKFPGAAKINQFLQEAEEATISYGEETAARSEESVKETGLSPEEFSYAGIAEYSIDSAVSAVTYFDKNYFSFYQEEYIYEGGAHGLPYRTGYVFDLQTGERLELKDIVANREEQLKEIITEYAEEYINRNPEIFWQDAVEIVREAAGYESSFYLTEDGIVFYYEPYMISSYAAGFQEITIPYEAFEMKLPIGKE